LLALADTSRLTAILGYSAAFCTTVAFAPQLLRVLRTQSTRDISAGMFSLLCLGLALWIFYGVRSASTPVIVANAATLFLAGAILGLKLRYEWSGRQEVPPPAGPSAPGNAGPRP
jgi:MtN3 and saliva related transmembrane protein